MKRFFLSNLLIFSTLVSVWSQTTLYFPPLAGSTWATTDPASLGWCQPRIDSLYQFLGDHHTRGFLLLKDGKIVLEKNFGTFTQDSLWYWASAGKSLTAALVGIAQQNGLLEIHQKTSDFLGKGWTSAPPEKEDSIQIWHQLTMTSGLDDKYLPPGVSDPNSCKTPDCLVFKADAGTRWAYHTGVYRLLHDVLSKASNQTINQYTKSVLLDKIGMKGLWANDVFFSRPRDMARFGLLMLADGKWDATQILTDPLYFQAMSQPSQPLNQSYGYLFWLNGQSSFMLPTLQFVFPGPLVPNAPPDAYMALGKNDQKIHIVPSKGWVVVRMGDAANGVAGDVPISFDNDLWSYLNKLDCSSAVEPQVTDNQSVSFIFPNPTTGDFLFKHEFGWKKITVFDAMGRRLKTISSNEKPSVGALSGALFFLKIEAADGRVFFQKLVKN